MPRLLLMGDVVLRCQRRADMEFAGLIQPPEWKSLISEQYGEMYSIVVQAGYRYFEASATITATGAASYPLPSDHDCSIGIDRVLDASGRTDQLDEMMIQERNYWAGQTGDAVAYSVVAQTVVLFPRPTSGTYAHLYVPQSPDLSALADTSTIDVVTADGEAFLINGVAAKALPKSGSDTRDAVAERDAARVRFAEDVTLRALINPRRRIVKSSPGDGGGGLGGGAYYGEYIDRRGGW